MPNGNTTSKTAVRGATNGATGNAAAMLVALASNDPEMDDDYICVWPTGANGDNAGPPQIYKVNGPVGSAPHRNPKNNFFRP